MDRLREWVRLHRMGRVREVARLVGMSPNTERTFRAVLSAAGVLVGRPMMCPSWRCSRHWCRCTCRRGCHRSRPRRWCPGSSAWMGSPGRGWGLAPSTLFSSEGGQGGGVPQGGTVPCTRAARGFVGPGSGPSAPALSLNMASIPPIRVAGTTGADQPRKPKGRRTPAACGMVDAERGVDVAPHLLDVPLPAAVLAEGQCANGRVGAEPLDVGAARSPAYGAIERGAEQRGQMPRPGPGCGSPRMGCPPWTVPVRSG